MFFAVLVTHDLWLVLNRIAPIFKPFRLNLWFSIFAESGLLLILKLDTFGICLFNRLNSFLMPGSYNGFSISPICFITCDSSFQRFNNHFVTKVIYPIKYFF